jgi:hypothetical protein
MMKVLQAYIQGLSISQRLPHSVSAVELADLAENERVAYAMIISLFAVCILGTDLECSSISQATEPRITPDKKSSSTLSPFRPHTLATLLSLIQFIIHSGNNNTTTLDLAYPIEELDPAQTILVRWGGTVPFCWTIWGDQRIAHMEIITHLVRVDFAALEWGSKYR